MKKYYLDSNMNSAWLLGQDPMDHPYIHLVELPKMSFNYPAWWVPEIHNYVSIMISNEGIEKYGSNMGGISVTSIALVIVFRSMPDTCVTISGMAVCI